MQYENKSEYINGINGKVYIGVTKKSINARLSGHFSAFRTNIEKGVPLNRLQKAFRKHGIECWMVDILKDNLTQDEAFAEEVVQIANHGSFGRKGYNATAGGVGQNHVIWTEYSKRKLSISLKEKWSRDPQIISLEKGNSNPKQKRKVMFAQSRFFSVALNIHHSGQQNGKQESACIKYAPNYAMKTIRRTMKNHHQENAHLNTQPKMAYSRQENSQQNTTK